MGKKKAPKPPKIALPQPSPQELALQQQQIDIANQMLSQGNITFQNSQDDRARALQYLDVLKNPPALSDSQMNLVNQLGDSYLNLYQKGITEGNAKETFDRNRRDTLAGLSDRGILNSTFGAEAIQDLYKEQSRQLAMAADQAGLQKLTTQQQMLQDEQNKNLNLFGTLYGGQLQGGASANSQLGNASTAAANVGAQLAQQRTDAFNVGVQNQQADYQYKLANFRQAQKKKSQIGGLATGALALGLIPFTGGLSAAGLAGSLGGFLGGGAALGAAGLGAAGYGLGSTFF